MSVGGETGRGTYVGGVYSQMLASDTLFKDLGSL